MRERVVIQRRRMCLSVTVCYHQGGGSAVQCVWHTSKSRVGQPFPCGVRLLFTSICFSCACLVMPTIECGCVFIVYYIVINMVVLATWWFILFIGVGNYLVLCCCNSLSLEIDCDIGL